MPRPKLPSPAMCVALLALALALGGTSYAALTVTSKQVRNNSLRSADVRNNTLTHRDIRNRSLRARDFARGQLPRGAAGPAGPAGPAGAAGPRGPSDVFATAAASVTLPPNSVAKEVVDLTVPAGAYLVTAATTLTNVDNLDAIAECEVRSGGTVVASTGPLSVGTESSERVAFQGVVTLAAPGALDLVCRSADDSGLGSAASSTVTALRTETVTVE